MANKSEFDRLFNKRNQEVGMNRQFNNNNRNYNYTGGVNIRKSNLTPDQYYQHMRQKQNQYVNTYLQKNNQSMMAFNNTMIRHNEQDAQQLINRKNNELLAQCEREANDKFNQLKQLGDNYTNNVEQVIIFYSPKCNFCKQLFLIFQKHNIDIKKYFNLVNVHNIPREKLLRNLKSVPALLVKSKNQLIQKQSVFNWIDNFIKDTDKVSSNEIDIDGKKIYGDLSSELGKLGCGASYSFMDDVYNESNSDMSNANINMPTNYDSVDTNNNGKSPETLKPYKETEIITPFTSPNANNSQQTKNPQYTPHVNGSNNTNSINNMQLPSYKTQKPKEAISQASINAYERMQKLRSNDVEYFKNYHRHTYNSNIRNNNGRNTQFRGY